MFRQWKLATVLAVALSASGSIDSAQAHIGGRGGGIRIGGGLVPRAKLGNGNRNGGNAGGVQAAPKTVVVPPVVPIGGTKNGAVVKPPVAAPATTNKPSVGNVAGSTGTIKSSPAAPTQVQAPAKVSVAVSEPQPKTPSNSNANQQSHLVFNLTGNAAPEATNEPDPNAADAPAAEPTGLPSETRKALEDVLATDDPAAETTPSAVKPVLATADFVSKEVALPQIPVGSTVTLNGKDLSEKEGQVVLQIGEIAMPATITAWKNNSVTCTLPVLGLTKSSKATLHVLKADGKTASMLECELVTTLPTGPKANP